MQCQKEMGFPVSLKLRERPGNRRRFAAFWNCALRAAMIVFHRLHQVVALGMIVGNLSQHLTDNSVFALLRA